MDPSRVEAYLTPSLLEMLGDAVTVISADWRYVFVSEGAARIIGRPAAEVVGAEVWRIFPEVVGTPQYDAIQRAMRERTRERLVWYFDTVDRWFEQHALPVGGGLLVLVNDITEQQLDAHRAEQLVVVGEALAGATTPEQVNEIVVEHVFCLIGGAGGALVVADEDHDEMRAIGWSGMDDRMTEQWSRYPLTSRTPAVEAFLTGRPVYVATLDQAEQRYPDIVADMLRIGRHTLAALPLVSAGAALGAMVVSFSSERELGVRDKQFLTTTAAMAAQALLRARLLAAERDSIAALQRSLLPTALPEAEGVSLTARYTASDATTEVGGDWFDVVPLAGGAVGLVMGDVEGHDLGAAALMGLVRSAVRASALDGHPPAVVMADANRFLVSLGLERIVTVAYLQLHPLERLVTAVSAGHLPGLSVDPLGQVVEVPTAVGPPLGVHETGMHWPETTSTLPPRCALVLFTDGLVELRGEDIDVGLDRVRASLVEHRNAPGPVLVDAVLASRARASRDDVALLCAQLTGEPVRARQLTRRLPPTPASVALGRRFTSQLLRAWQLDDLVDSAELIMSELLTNAARHSEDAIVVRVSRDDHVLRLEVEDTSHRMPDSGRRPQDVPEEATAGRGLMLVEAVSSRWGVESEGLSKTVWAELDLEH